MSKLGQIIGQALLFALGAIIFAMTLIYGYSAISKLTQVKSEVCLIDMQKTLKNQVERVRASFGTVRRMDLTICAGHTEICFIDRDRVLEGQSGPCQGERINKLAQRSSLMKDAVCSGSDQNVFLKPASATPITIGTITVDHPDGFLCFEDIEASTISLRLEGKGDHTQIGTWKIIE
ncbi:hypothetical protein HY641_04935 [Candidatus Woesearchaeota archaeon]|nr:hypothetical protein [Candidatus Woesearchaeota archaeon]